MYKIIEVQAFLDGNKKKHCNNILYRLKNEVVEPIIALRSDFDGITPEAKNSFKPDKLWFNNSTRITKDVTNKIHCVKESKDGFNSYKIMYKNIQIGFNVSDICYSEKQAVEMWINKGFLFRGI